MKPVRLCFAYITGFNITRDFINNTKYEKNNI